MPRCPDCRRTFAVLEDEQGMHDCPYCGLSPYGDTEEPEEDTDGTDEDGPCDCPICVGGQDD